MLSSKMKSTAIKRAGRIADKYINRDGSSLSDDDRIRNSPKPVLSEDQLDMLRYIFLNSPAVVHKLLAIGAARRLFNRTSNEIFTILSIVDGASSLLRMEDAKKNGTSILAKLKKSIPHESFLDEGWLGKWVIVFHPVIKKGDRSYGWQTMGAGGGWTDDMFEGWIPLPD